MIAVQGKPSKFTRGIKDPELHLVPVDYSMCSISRNSDDVLGYRA